jgi:hypothetical protein
VDAKVGTFHLNNVHNGFSAGYHIHHNNGVPSKTQRTEMRAEYEAELAGEDNAGGILMTFSEGPDRKTELTPLAASDLDKQFNFVSPEATKKILIGHQVPAPILFAIREGGGLGNNKEEMAEGMRLLNENVLDDYRDAVTEALEYVFGVPWEILQPDETEQEGQETGVAMSKEGIQIIDDRPVMPEDAHVPMLKKLKEVAIPRQEFEEDWQLVDSEVIDGPPAGDDAYTRHYAFAIQSNANEKSRIDRGFYRVRYAYVAAPGEPDLIDTSRKFCTKMMTEFKDSIFRREDINTMTRTVANKEFGRYSIWQYKGSYNCRHVWKRLVYFLKRVPAGQSVTIDGKTYKGGQFLPGDRMEHFKLLPGIDVPGGVDDRKARQRN